MIARIVICLQSIDRVSVGLVLVVGYTMVRNVFSLVSLEPSKHTIPVIRAQRAHHSYVIRAQRAYHSYVIRAQRAHHFDVIRAQEIHQAGGG